MLFVRRRWPWLAALLAAASYLINGGSVPLLPSLLSPTSSSSSSIPEQAPLNGASDRLGYDIAQFGIQTTPLRHETFGLDSAPTPGGTGWGNGLSAGEKLALWQQRLDSRPTAGVDRGQGMAVPSLPIAAPIPAPRTLQLSGEAPARPVLDAWPASPRLGKLPDLLSTTSEPRNEAARDRSDSRSTTALARSSGRPATSDLRLRVASFKTDCIDSELVGKPNVLRTLGQILSCYDVIALQGIRSSRDDLLPLIVESLNREERTYDYLIGPRVGRGELRQQFAILFNTQRVETDRYQLYTVDDPHDLITYEPLVAWFRCKQPPADKAFTFSLINLCIDSRFADAERSRLPTMIDAIKQDGRDEDDWLLVGDFAGGVETLTALQSRQVRLALQDLATDLEGSRTLDNIIFSARATTEFTGRCGAFDFLRKYNLSFERAAEISQRMPVWAEFSIFEGADPGRLAPSIEDPTVY